MASKLRLALPNAQNSTPPTSAHVLVQERRPPFKFLGDMGSLGVSPMRISLREMSVSGSFISCLVVSYVVHLSIMLDVSHPTSFSDGRFVLSENSKYITFCINLFCRYT